MIPGRQPGTTRFITAVYILVESTRSANESHSMEDINENNNECSEQAAKMPVIVASNGSVRIVLKPETENSVQYAVLEKRSHDAMNNEIWLAIDGWPMGATMLTETIAISLLINTLLDRRDPGAIIGEAAQIIDEFPCVWQDESIKSNVLHRLTEWAIYAKDLGDVPA